MKLVDAKQLIKDLKCELKYDINMYNSHIEKEIRDEKIRYAIEVLEDASVDYDVDKVIEELIELKEDERDDSDEEEPEFTDVEDWYDEGVSSGKFYAYNKAIKIVKNGGIDNEN